MSAAHDFRIIGESESSDETIIRCTKCGKEIRYPGGPCDDATKLR
jgi:RNase P subunit RPR2